VAGAGRKGKGEERKEGRREADRRKWPVEQLC
jgi:hypothetical protein